MVDKKKRKMALVLCAGELDRALGCMNIAVGGASMGMDVAVFCTFFGLNAIRKDGVAPAPRPEEEPKRVGLFGARAIRRAFARLNPGGGKYMNPSRFSFWGLGRRTMARLMRDSRMANLDELIELGSSLGVKFIACTTSLEALGISRDNLRPEVSEFAGVATFLAEALESDVQLFI
jgi:peroxiredoxin family protein